MEEQERRKAIRKRINHYITRKRYGEFTGIIREIIERRYMVFEYTMDDDRIEKELDGFVNYMKTIRFADDIEYDGRKDIGLGYYRPFFKEIVIFDKLIPKQMDLLYAIMTHEIYHALSIHKDGKITGLKRSSNKEQTITGLPLNEAFNEYGAYLAYTQNRKEKEKFFGPQTKGYPSMTFIPQLFSAALGIPETNIVGKGLKNRNALYNEIYRNIDGEKASVEDRKIAIYEFDKFESNVNILFNLRSKSEEDSTIDEKTRLELTRKSMQSIFDYGLNQFEKMIKWQGKIIDPGDEEAIKKFAYCYYKIETLGPRACANVMDYNNSRIFIEEQKQKSKKIETLITDINKIVRVGKEIGNEKDYKYYLELATKGNIDEAIDLIKEKYNIEISKEKEELEKVVTKEDAANSEFSKFMEENDFKRDKAFRFSKLSSIIKLNLILIKKKLNPFNLIDRVLYNRKLLPQGGEAVEKENESINNSRNEEVKEANTEKESKSEDKNMIKETETIKEKEESNSSLDEI